MLFIQLIYSAVFHVTRHQPIALLYLPVYKPHTNHNSLIRSDEGNAQNVSFSNLFMGWPVHVINAVDKIKLSCTQYHSFFKKLTPFFINGMLDPSENTGFNKNKTCQTDKLVMQNGLRR